jgi:NAD(P)H-hydrate epimerase
MNLPRIITVEQARELDRRAVADYGMQSIQLMENAGRGVADVLCQLGVAGRVVICCGHGANGGDGLVVARHLDLRGVAVETLLFVPPHRLAGAPTDRPPTAEELRLGHDTAVNYRALCASGIPLRVAASAEHLAQSLIAANWIVDALLGTGASGEPRSPLDQVIAGINMAGAQVLAIDLPSGLDATTGVAAKNTVRANHTCTFVAGKPGLIVPGVAVYVGQLHVLDIGAPRRLCEELLGSNESETI